MAAIPMPPCDGGDFYRTVFLTSPDGLLVVDAAGTIVMANPRARELFGYGDGELAGVAIEALVPERLRGAHAAHRAAYASRPHPRPMGGPLMLHGLRRDGAEFPVEIALSPALDGGDGRLYLAAVRDVSERVRSEQAARRARYSGYVARFGMEALARIDFEQLLASAPTLVREAMEADAVVILRLSADRTRFTSAAASGLPDDSLRDVEVPNDPALLAGYVAAARTAVASRDFRTETRFGVPDALKNLGLRAVVAVPLFDHGRVIGLISARSRQPRDFGEDDVNFLQSIANVLATVLQRTNVEERLAHAQRLESLGQLTGGVAHDFNNLLMVISGNLQVLEETMAAGEGQELARAAAAAADRGAMLTRKLLAFARKQPLQPRPVELAHLLRDFRDLVQRTLGETVALELEQDASVPVLLVDAAQLETALLNLAINARDAMPHGGRVAIAVRRVRIDAEIAAAPSELAPGEYACISVTDSGSGMPREVLERAFEPFFTTKGPGKGSGLGLSMVYGFARQSGGSAHVYSEPGLGTSVKLYLPLPPGALRLQPVAAPLAPAVGDETVLVVEDEPSVGRVAELFLSRMGYRVLHAGDGESALDIVARERDAVSVLFTDLVLPGMNGVELARRARELHPRLAVLYTSGYASTGVLRTLPEEQLRRLLPKPYRAESLAAAVRQALDRRRPGG